MRKNLCSLPAPSTSAASYSSEGMDWSAPRATTIMNGKPASAPVRRSRDGKR